MKAAILMVAALGLLGATPALAQHTRVGGTVQIRFGRPAPPPVIHYSAPACPPVVIYHQPSYGRWEYHTVQVWRPGYWTTVQLPCGRYQSQWVHGRYELMQQRVWVH